jgi:GGDEF domain-containing protein
MTWSSLYEGGSKLLTPGAFEFILESELKRAVRSQRYLTLVMVDARREWEQMTVTADAGTLQDVGQIIGKEIRDTDLLAHTDEGTLTFVLLDADFDDSTKVVDRVVARMKSHEFSTALHVVLGAACFPTHAVDAGSLKRHALAHPLVGWRVKRTVDPDVPQN